VDTEKKKEDRRKNFLCVRRGGGGAQRNSQINDDEDKVLNEGGGTPYNAYSAWVESKPSGKKLATSETGRRWRRLRSFLNNKKTTMGKAGQGVTANPITRAQCLMVRCAAGVDRPAGREDFRQPPSRPMVQR
jgi:hypothetical protein